MWTTVKELRWVQGWHAPLTLESTLQHFGNARLGHLESLTLEGDPWGQVDSTRSQAGSVSASALQACLQSCSSLVSLSLLISIKGAHIATLLQHAPQVSKRACAAFARLLLCLSFLLTPLHLEMSHAERN